MLQLNDFIRELENVGTYHDLNQLTENVMEYVRSFGDKTLYPAEYFYATIEVTEKLDSMTTLDKIKMLQSNHTHTFSGEEFIEMLQFAKIRVAQSCHYVEYISNNQTAKIMSGDRRVWNAVYNALDKLLAYEC